MRTFTEMLKRSAAEPASSPHSAVTAVVEAMEGRRLMSGDPTGALDSVACSNNLTPVYLGSYNDSMSASRSVGDVALTDTTPPDYVGVTDIWRAP